MAIRIPGIEYEQDRGWPSSKSNRLAANLLRTILFLTWLSGAGSSKARQSQGEVEVDEQHSETYGLLERAALAGRAPHEAGAVQWRGQAAFFASIKTPPSQAHTRTLRTCKGTCSALCPHFSGDNPYWGPPDNHYEASVFPIHPSCHHLSGSALETSCVQVPIKLPVLTPMEIKILASVGERAWIKIDTKASPIDCTDKLSWEIHSITPTTRSDAGNHAQHPVDS